MGKGVPTKVDDRRDTQKRTRERNYTKERGHSRTVKKTERMLQKV